MNKNFVIFTYFLASLILVGFFAKSLNLLVNYAEPESPVESLVLLDSNNALKYASGSCAADEECVITGCSSEVCASETVFSTCELKSDVPSADIYRCGCNQGLCAWIKK